MNPDHGRRSWRRVPRPIAAFVVLFVYWLSRYWTVPRKDVWSWPRQLVEAAILAGGVALAGAILLAVGVEFLTGHGQSFWFLAGLPGTVAVTAAVFAVAWSRRAGRAQRKLDERRPVDLGQS